MYIGQYRQPEASLVTELPAVLCSPIVGHLCQNLEGFCFLMTWRGSFIASFHQQLNEKGCVLNAIWSPCCLSYVSMRSDVLLSQICLPKTMESQRTPCNEGRSGFFCMSLFNDPCPSLLAYCKAFEANSALRVQCDCQLCIDISA